MAGYVMLFGQLHHFQGQQPVMILDGHLHISEARCLASLSVERVVERVGLVKQGLKLHHRMLLIFFVPWCPLYCSGWLENCRLMK